ncbi:MAG: GNAT family N-acetyltransferase [Candidatus Obscuribacterales bacterium]|nr:GNAT family N-acetyltransferase [Candidatus Obscuribacterales bacterium]
MKPPLNFKKTSELSALEIEAINQILDGRQPFSIYFNSALADLASGLDNRNFHINPGHGVAMHIDFQDVCVFTIVGVIDKALIDSMVAHPKKCEFHVHQEYANEIAARAEHRIAHESELRYYHLKLNEPFAIGDFDLRVLDRDDLPTVQEFYSENYDQTIFSPWMLENPFVGLFIDDQLVSSGGTIIIDEKCAAANIGNFLTEAKSRGKGYSKLVVKALVNRLLERGIHSFSLGTTTENASACRVYEAIGFSLIETRTELLLKFID